MTGTANTCPRPRLDNIIIVEGNLGEKHKLVFQYVGHWPNQELPCKKGDMVTILKGTRIHTTNGKGIKAAGRTYRVKIHHVLNGCSQPGYWRNPKIEG